MSGGLDDATSIGAGIDELNLKFNALREAMDKAIDGPAEARKDAARKIVAEVVTEPLPAPMRPMPSEPIVKRNWSKKSPS